LYPDWLTVEIVFVFTGGQISYATVRYFDSGTSERLFEDVAIQPALLTDLVSGIIFDS
jgi:hypothetical protein